MKCFKTPSPTNNYMFPADSFLNKSSIKGFRLRNRATIISVAYSRITFHIQQVKHTFITYSTSTLCTFISQYRDKFYTLQKSFKNLPGIKKWRCTEGTNTRFVLAILHGCEYWCALRVLDLLFGVPLTQEVWKLQLQSKHHKIVH